MTENSNITTELLDAIQDAFNRHDVDRILSAVDILALPSLSEGLPFAAMEAMAAGMAVVASRVGALPELLDEGQAGVVVRPGAVEELASRLAEVVADAQRRTRLAACGRQRVMEEFNFEAMIDCTEAIMSKYS